MASASSATNVTEGFGTEILAREEFWLLFVYFVGVLLCFRTNICTMVSAVFTHLRIKLKKIITKDKNLVIGFLSLVILFDKTDDINKGKAMNLARYLLDIFCQNWLSFAIVIYLVTGFHYQKSQFLKLTDSMCLCMQWIALKDEPKVRRSGSKDSKIIRKRMLTRKSSKRQRKRNISRGKVSFTNQEDRLLENLLNFGMIKASFNEDSFGISTMDYAATENIAITHPKRNIDESMSVLSDTIVDVQNLAIDHLNDYFDDNDIDFIAGVTNQPVMTSTPRDPEDKTKREKSYLDKSIALIFSDKSEEFTLLHSIEEVFDLGNELMDQKFIQKNQCYGHKMRPQLNLFKPQNSFAFPQCPDFDLYPSNQFTNFYVKDCWPVYNGNQHYQSPFKIPSIW